MLWSFQRSTIPRRDCWLTQSFFVLVPGSLSLVSAFTRRPFCARAFLVKSAIAVVAPCCSRRYFPFGLPIFRLTLPLRLPSPRRVPSPTPQTGHCCRDFLMDRPPRYVIIPSDRKSPILAQGFFLGDSHRTTPDFSSSSFSPTTLPPVGNFHPGLTRPVPAHTRAHLSLTCSIGYIAVRFVFTSRITCRKLSSRPPAPRHRPISRLHLSIPDFWLPRLVRLR